MIISYAWLLRYLPEPVPVAELSRILTAIGLEVEAVETVESVKGSLEGLVTGVVLTCEKHPDADKLKITTVDTGSGTPLHIVCGAPNVAAGQKVVVAPVGATVHPLEGEPFRIKKAKIRGAVSEGMICAEDEISLGKSHDGILVLPEHTPVGISAKDWFNIPEPDYAIHIGLTPNRSDAMSHIGVAGDVCAYQTHHTGKKWEVVLPVLPAFGRGGVAPFNVYIAAEEACKRYAGMRISGVRVGPSPGWLQQCLKTVGLRSVNNIVDVTNFVLHEYGQPLHAFDADRISGGEIHVRFLPAGTSFITLDEKERKLQGDDLMICDAERPLCIAGVFGGLTSGVTEATTDVFLESAFFHPVWIRRTSLHHGLRTDAALRFEKTVDDGLLIPALERAAALICEIAGGHASQLVDVVAEAPGIVRVACTYDYINRVCGKEFSPESVHAILQALRFEIEKSDAVSFTVKVPGNKPDVRQPADIAEEILRIDGLDNIPVPDRLNISLAKSLPDDRAVQERIANTLCGAGFHEILTNSIVNSRYYPGREDLVRLLNSLSSELDVLRPSMLESGLEVIRYNINRQQSGLALFEHGKVYTQEAEHYRELPVLAIWITGDLIPAQWNRKQVSADIFYLKGVIRHLLSADDIRNVAEVPDHAHMKVEWKWKNKTLASAIAVDAQILQQFDLKQDVYYAVIDWALWIQAASAVHIRYTGIPKFPAVRRDLAVVLDRNVAYSEVKKVTEQLKLEAMQSFELFDVFESEKLGDHKKSLALSYTFRLQDRTLTDQETDAMMQQLIRAYTSGLNAQIRE